MTFIKIKPAKLGCFAMLKLFEKPNMKNSLLFWLMGRKDWDPGLCGWRGDGMRWRIIWSGRNWTIRKCAKVSKDTLRVPVGSIVVQLIIIKIGRVDFNCYLRHIILFLATFFLYFKCGNFFPLLLRVCSPANKPKTKKRKLKGHLDKVFSGLIPWSRF